MLLPTDLRTAREPSILSTLLLQHIANGLLDGVYYLLIALGLSLIFSLGGIVNLAHGAFYAIGAYLTIVISPHVGFGGSLILERALQRLEWDRTQEAAKKQEDDELERERDAMAMIDWHDFVVVESIDFFDEEDEDLPMPLTLRDVVAQLRDAEAEMGAEGAAAGTADEEGVKEGVQRGVKKGAEKGVKEEARSVHGSAGAAT